MLKDPVAEIIACYVDDDRHVFVFPSEVAGEYRLRQALKLSRAQAVRADRCISWDRLKELEFSPHQDRIPANALYRTIFSASLLEEHRRNGALLRFLAGGPRNGNASVFQHQLAGILPQLQKAVRGLDTAVTGFPEELAHDLRMLYERYTDFLDRTGLFEPSYLQPRSEGTGAEQSPAVYHIFYPELIDDFVEYRTLTEAHEAYTVHGFSGAEPGPMTEMHRFSNARRECACVTAKIDGLLREGIHPGDIAVTLPEYEGWQPFLAEEAEIRDIPLDFRSGMMLGEYPAGLLFQRLSDLLRAGMHLETMKLLFLEPAYPWKDEDILRELIRFGIEHYYLTNWKENDRQRDELSRKLKSSGREDLLKLYRNLRGQIVRMVNAPTVKELRAHVHTFLHSFFSAEQWEPEAERVLQYCLFVLQELEDAEDRLNGETVPSPYSFWTALLSRRMYVSPGRKEAVPVYRYRVSAGITPGYHFIPGAGQGETRARREDFIFLRDDYRAMLSVEAAVDASSAFLNVYSHSGEHVYMSCSDLGFSGPQLPPSEMLAAGYVVKESGLVDNDPYEDEERYWSRDGFIPSELYPLQVRGFEAMNYTGFSEKEIDFTREPVADEVLLRHVTDIAKGEKGIEDGRVWFTPTAFDLYNACPFAFFLQRGIGLTEEDYSAVQVDHLLMGNILHRLIASLYREVQERDGRWIEEHVDEYLVMAGDLCDREFARWERRGLDFIQPVWQWFTENSREQIRGFIRQEGSQFDGFELAGTETELASACDDHVGMWGRIDRLSEKDGSTVLVDYKKGKAPSTSDIYEQEGLPAVSQLPFYAIVARQNGREITAAGYYSIQEGSYTYVYCDPGGPLRLPSRKRPRLEPEQFHRQMELIAAGVVQQAGRILRGDFAARENCNSCSLRAVCRTRYTLKLPGEYHGA